MAEPVKWNVDDGRTTVEVKHDDDGTRIEIRQNDDVIHLDHTGASPGSLVDAVCMAIESTKLSADFEPPTVLKGKN